MRYSVILPGCLRNWPGYTLSLRKGRELNWKGRELNRKEERRESDNSGHAVSWQGLVSMAAPNNGQSIHRDGCLSRCLVQFSGDHCAPSVYRHARFGRPV